MSVTLSLFAGAGAQFFDNNGNPLSGGKIYTYAAGTTTPNPTYTTNSDSSLHTNPIVLDAAGRVPSGGEIWLQLGVGYKFVVKTSAEVLIATYDNIPSSAQPPAANDADSIMYEQGYTVTAGSFVVGKIYRIASVGTTNFTLIGAVNNTVGTHFIATGVGTGTGTAQLSQTVETKLQEFISVKDFGAVGDGVVDDIAAINAAIAYAKATTNVKGIYFPTGNYRITNSIDARGNFNNGLELWGFRTTITSTGNFPALRLNGRVPDTPPEVRMKAYVHGFVFDGPGKANTSSVGIDVQRGANVVVKDCQMYGYYRGLYCFGNLISNYENLYISRCFTGIEAAPDGIEFAPNDLHFTNCQVVDNDRILRAINFPNGAMTFIGCELEGNNLSGNVSDGVRVIEFFNAGKVTLQGCHLEANPGQYNIYFDSSSGNHLNIIGCEIIPGDDCGNALFMANATGNPNLFVAGSRITNNDTGLGQKQIFLSTGAKALIVGPFNGNLSGDVSNTVLIRDGRIGTGGVIPSFAAIRAAGSSGISYDALGIYRFIDSSENRLGYLAPNAIRKDANTEYTIGANNAADISLRRLGTDTFEPARDNSYNLGTGGLRWKEIFAANGTINTSDKREKQVKTDGIDPAVLRAWGKVDFTQFKWKQAIEEKGESARWHFGVIAQKVKEAFESEGLDAFAYGLLCYNEWDDFYEDELDENGVPTGNTVLRIKAGSRYGIRYEEALALECAYLRSKLKG